VYLPAGCSFGLDSPRGTAMACCLASPCRSAAAGVPVPGDYFDAAARHEIGRSRGKWQWSPQRGVFLLSHNAHRYKGQSGNSDHPIRAVSSPYPSSCKFLLPTLESSSPSPSKDHPSPLIPYLNPPLSREQSTMATKALSKSPTRHTTTTPAATMVAKPSDLRQALPAILVGIVAGGGGFLFG
jgi:hypothetical protein